MLPLLALAVAAPVATVADATGPIRVDGVIDEAAWEAATPVTDFLKYLPTDGGAAPGRTEVRFVQDERFLYVSILVSEVAYRVRARMSQRELINADDQIGLYLDTFHDGRTGYIFYTNAVGIQQDIRHNNGTWNADWDTAYRSKGRVTEDGFELELAMPWRSIRYPEGEEPQTWGLILTRKVPSEGAKYAFPDIERNHPRLFQQAAELRGVKPGSRGTGLDLAPALTAAWSDTPDSPARQPTSAFQIFRPSVDARYAITPDIGLAGTINPDFSQVESDIRDVRLNARFAYQFPERRPFFLDGIDAFQDPNNTLYTRTIDEPVYGLKVSGRQDGVSTGLVHALDRSPLPSFHEGGTPGFAAEDVEGHQAFTTMARVQKDAFGAGYVGVTFADKRLVGRSSHFDIGAFDMVVPLGDRFVASWSHAQSVAGDSPSALWGSSTQASIQRASGIGTGGQLSVVDRSPGYRNEVGFVTQSAYTQAVAALDHTLTPPGVVDTITPRVYAQAFEERNEDRDHYRQLAFQPAVVADGIHTFSLDAGLVEVREATVVVPGRYLTLDYAGQIGALVEWSPRVQVARSTDYALLLPADDTTGELEATLRYAGLRLDTTARVARHVPQGFDPQLATFVRSRLGAQFTRTLGLRLIGEHTQGTELDQALLRSSALLTWLDVPGTAAYVGYSEDTALGDRWEAVERSVFAKVSVLLRP